MMSPLCLAMIPSTPAAQHVTPVQEAQMPTVVVPDVPDGFTNRDLAAARGWTVDAAEKWLRRRAERGEFVRKHVALVNPETRRKYWTFLYRPNPAYVSPAMHAQQRGDARREVCKVISDAVKAEQAVEDLAVQPYLEPAGPHLHSECFADYYKRHARARDRYFVEHPGTREAHAARWAAQTVVYELQNGRRPARRDVDLARVLAGVTTTFGKVSRNCSPRRRTHRMSIRRNEQ